MKQKISLSLLLIALLLLGGLTVIVVQQLFFKTATPKSITSAIAEKLPAGDFTLNSLDGKVSLSDFKGKVVLLYFGYTACPEICPTALTSMGKAMAQLNDNEKQQVQGVFVSVDPERDSLKQLKEYSQHFSQQIMGLTGTKTEVDDIARRYAINSTRQQKNKNGSYDIDHSSTILLIDKEGQLKDLLSSEKIVKKIRDYL
jgi:protein SCO1/2